MLRKTLISCFLLIGILHSGYTQYLSDSTDSKFKALLVGGLNFSSIRADSLSNYDMATGIIGGISGSYILADPLHVKGLLQYSTRGAIAPSAVNKLRIHYLDVQLLPELRLGKYFKLQAGIQYSFLLSARRRTMTGETPSGYESFSLDNYTNQLEYLVGAEFPLQKNLFLGAKYSLPVQDAKYSNFQVSLSWNFNNVRIQTKKGYQSVSSALKAPSEVEKLQLNAKELWILPREVFSFPNLKDLSMTRNNLTGLPDSISKIQSLKDLALQHNAFRSLPKGILGLKNLNYLNISYNDLQSLPDSIDRLKNLEYLYLGNNALTSLPASIGKLQNLRVLSLRNNELKKLPPEFFDLESLIELDLYHSGLLRIPDAVERLKTLERLYVDKNIRIPANIEAANPRLEIILGNQKTY